MFIKRLCFAALAIIILINGGCGFRLQHNYSIPDALKSVNLTSQDEFSELTRLVREHLRLNNIKLVDADKSVANLHILGESLNRSTLSLYPTGTVAEYGLNYHVSFSVQLPKQQPKSFNVDIYRDYLDDPRTALAKSREMDLLSKEMRRQASEQIIQTLASIETL